MLAGKHISPEKPVPGGRFEHNYHLKGQQMHIPTNSGRVWIRALQGFISLSVLVIILSKLVPYCIPHVSDKTTLFRAMSQAELTSKATSQQETHSSSTCTSLIASKRYQFEFNVTDGSNNQFEVLESAIPESSKSLRGEILIISGQSSQASDILVHVNVHSNGSDIDNVLVQRSDSGLNIDYKFTDQSELGTEIWTFIYLRPGTRISLDLLHLRTSILDVYIDMGDMRSDLDWAFNNLVAHTSYSTFEVELWSKPPLAHNFSVSSINGTIVGSFSPDENLELRNLHGPIWIWILPMLFDSPFDPKRISVETVSGDIELITEHGGFPLRPYGHRTEVATVSGNILVGIVHGSYTRISSISGDVEAYITPFGAATENDQSEIYASLWTGKMSVFLDRTWPDSLHGHHDPLLNTKSSHTVGEGELNVVYPDDWYGNFTLRVLHPEGRLEYNGSSLEDVLRGPGYVEARRGPIGAGESVMEARVGAGHLEVQIGL